VFGGGGRQTVAKGAMVCLLGAWPAARAQEQVRLYVAVDVSVSAVRNAVRIAASLAPALRAQLPPETSWTLVCFADEVLRLYPSALANSADAAVRLLQEWAANLPPPGVGACQGAGARIPFPTREGPLNACRTDFAPLFREVVEYFRRSVGRRNIVWLISDGHQDAAEPAGDEEHIPLHVLRQLGGTQLELVLIYAGSPANRANIGRLWGPSPPEDALQVTIEPEGSDQRHLIEELVARMISGEVARVRVQDAGCESFEDPVRRRPRVTLRLNYRHTYPEGCVDECSSFVAIHPASQGRPNWPRRERLTPTVNFELEPGVPSPQSVGYQIYVRLAEACRGRWHWQERTLPAEVKCTAMERRIVRLQAARLFAAPPFLNLKNGAQLQVNATYERNPEPAQVSYILKADLGAGPQPLPEATIEGGQWVSLFEGKDARSQGRSAALRRAEVEFRYPGTTFGVPVVIPSGEPAQGPLELYALNMGWFAWLVPVTGLAWLVYAGAEWRGWCRRRAGRTLVLMWLALCGVCLAIFVGIAGIRVDRLLDLFRGRSPLFWDDRFRCLACFWLLAVWIGAYCVRFRSPKDYWIQYFEAASLLGVAFVLFWPHVRFVSTLLALLVFIVHQRFHLIALVLHFIEPEGAELRR